MIWPGELLGLLHLHDGREALRRSHENGSWKQKYQKNISIWLSFQRLCARGPSRWAAEFVGGSPSASGSCFLLFLTLGSDSIFRVHMLMMRGCGSGVRGSLANCNKGEAHPHERGRLSSPTAQPSVSERMVSCAISQTVSAWNLHCCLPHPKGSLGMGGGLSLPYSQLLVLGEVLWPSAQTLGRAVMCTVTLGWVFPLGSRNAPIQKVRPTGWETGISSGERNGMLSLSNSLSLPQD